MSGTRPSKEILLELVRGRAVTDRVNGAELFGASLNQKVAGLIAVAAAEGRLALDLGDRQQFEMQCLAIEHSNRQSLMAVQQIAHILDGTGFRVGLVKGLAVSLLVYGRLDVRPASDVDLFVGPGTEPIEVVEALGVELSDLQATTIRQLTARHAAFEFSFRFNGVEIDLHSDPMNLLLPALQAQLIWDRSIALDLGNGSTIQTLDPDLALLQTLIHIARDNVADLIRISDVRLMMAARPDTRFISRFCETEGWTAIIGEVSDRVFGLLDDESPFERPTDRISGAFFSRLWPTSTMLLGQQSRARSGLRQYWLGAAISGRRREAAVEVRHRVFPPDEIVRLRGGSQSGPYLWRVVSWRLAQRRELRLATGDR